MTSYMIAFGPCCVCGNVFSFNPDQVPSILMDPETGRPPDVDENGHPTQPSPEAAARAVKRPYCPVCAKALNTERRARGEEPIFDETDTAL